MADLKATVRSMYNGISGASDVSAMLDEHVTEDFVEHEEMAGIQAGTGRDLAEQQISMMQRAISDLRFNVDELVQEDNKVVARVTVTGTHTGEFMGIPASGNKLEFRAIDVFHFRGDKISDHWGVTDSAAMMMQMGAIEPPG
jgi:steroid delta-isomerase-like uncharacterized protein